MVSNKYFRIVLSTILMVIGIFILNNYNSSIISLSAGCLLILIGLVWLVVGTTTEGIKLYKEVVAPYDTKTRNWTAILILISILFVYLLFKYFGLIS